MNISGKTAYVTGGASGLGEATIRRLHDAGANVMIADFNRQNGEALCKALGASVVSPLYLDNMPVV